MYEEAALANLKRSAVMQLQHCEIKPVLALLRFALRNFAYANLARRQNANSLIPIFRTTSNTC